MLSPFDPVVWFRERGERLFDFAYKLEIYTPAAKRKFGYYVLPFLMGDRIAGDSTARPIAVSGSLRVRRFAETGADRTSPPREWPARSTTWLPSWAWTAGASRGTGAN